MDGALDAVGEYLPDGDRRGSILVVSDHRPLNLLHADALCAHGYAVYTAITCTDVPRLLERFGVQRVDAVAFASLVHGWHHREGEECPGGEATATAAQWQTRNIGDVVTRIRRLQVIAPRVLVAEELIRYGFYDVGADALAAAGIEYAIYSASDPCTMLGALP